MKLKDLIAEVDEKNNEPVEVEQEVEQEVEDNSDENDLETD